jgi:hypothetical protein
MPDGTKMLDATKKDLGYGAFLIEAPAGALLCIARERMLSPLGNTFMDLLGMGGDYLVLAVTDDLLDMFPEPPSQEDEDVSATVEREGP